MKTPLFKLFVFFCLAISFTACQKKVDLNNEIAEKRTGLVTDKVYPLEGNEVSAIILPKSDLPHSKLLNFYGHKVKVIDSVCDEYLKSTKKVDISKIKDGEFIFDIGNSKFGIASITGFRKINAGPKGWWTHWGYNPYVSSEYPNVLFSEGDDGYVGNFLILVFSKKVSTFGFEVAPNATGVNLKCSVGYQENNTPIENEMFSVEQMVSSPSGARQIAVKSETPFSKVTIYLQDSDPGKRGLAISNIRYALAK